MTDAMALRIATPDDKLRWGYPVDAGDVAELIADEAFRLEWDAEDAAQEARDEMLTELLEAARDDDELTPGFRKELVAWLRGQEELR